ncbi:MAG: hypothetical protein AB1445_13225 [Bacillota bacterium]
MASVASSQGLAGGVLMYGSFNMGPGLGSTADGLLLSGQYEPAVTIMEQQLAADPSDHHARLWLVRFYLYGDEHGHGQDRERARELYQELMAAIPTPWTEWRGR